MIKIAMFTDSFEMSGAFWRSTGPFMTLKEVCDIQVSWMPKEKTSWADIAEADIVFMHRPQSEIDSQIFSVAKDFCKPIWTDWDDHLFDIPWDNDTHTNYFDKSVRSRMRAMIAKSDHVTVSTITMKDAWIAEMKKFVQELPEAERFLKGFENRITICRNGLNPRWVKWRSTKKRADKIRVLWRGSPHHKLDIEHIQGHVIKTANNNPDVEFWMVGLRPWKIMANAEHANVIHASPQMVNQYMKFLNQIRPDIQWTTLYDNPFNRAKSNIAQLEGAMAGAITICPDWPEVWETEYGYAYKNPNHFAELLQKSIDETMKDRKSVNDLADKVWDIFMVNPGKYNLDNINANRFHIIKKLTGITPAFKVKAEDSRVEPLQLENQLGPPNESIPPVQP